MEAQEVHRRLNEKDAEANPSTTSRQDAGEQLQLQQLVATDPQVERSHCIHAEKIRCHAGTSDVRLAICAGFQKLMVSRLTGHVSLRLDQEGMEQSLEISEIKKKNQEARSTEI